MSAASERPGGAAPGAQPHFRSVDSAPPALSVTRRRRTGVGFQLLFAVAAVLFAAWGAGTEAFRQTFPSGDLILAPIDGKPLIAIRVFGLLFFTVFCCFLKGALHHRLGLWITMVARFVLLCMGVDVIATLCHSWWGLRLPVNIVQIVVGLGCFAVFAWTILDHAAMPVPHARTPRPRRWPVTSIVLASVLMVGSIAAAIAIERLFLGPVLDLRSVALLGGVGPGVFLVPSLFFGVLALAAALRNRARRGAGFAPPLAVLVPAHNEQHQIAATIAALDAAAARYDGPVTVYIVDNASRDDTPQVARRALSQSRWLGGCVLSCTTPGKAKALNYGLAAIREDYVLRLDADTRLAPDAIAMAARHFADPQVGAVGGLPFPFHRRTFITRARQVEILIKHGLYQMALGTIDGTIGVPGMAVMYRCDTLVALGGFTEGMNGEDTDISLRIGESGLRLVTDPAMVFYTEVPDSLEHLREQRLRWFRSIYHVSARNRPLLLSRPSVRSLFVLPWYLINAGRRAMMIPLLSFAAATWGLAPDLYPRLDLAEVAAVVFGAPAMVALMTILTHRQWGSLAYLPEYFVFRILRAHYTLESALTMLVRRRDEPGRQQAPSVAGLNGLGATR